MITTNDLEFSQQLLAQKADVVESYRQFVHRIILGLLEKIVLGTPVATGRARGNWFVSISEPSTEIVEEIVQVGNVLIRAERVLESSSGFELYWVTNNLPYIEALELGTSQQAPDGWIRIAIATVEAEVEAEL